jgi:hypothetical protein
MPPTTIQQLRRSFKDVSMEGDEIDIVTFLEASEGLLQVLGMSFYLYCTVEYNEQEKEGESHASIWKSLLDLHLLQSRATSLETLPCVLLLGSHDDF